ncbi:hypothetical protein [Kitasatospora aureofaciens]|uniref:hypothetical protein n=1 Tax=Kitasatospora aureofaciens TaxID=1894 RepID=UPI0033C8905D
MAFPLVLLVAAEAGELDRPDVPVLQPVAGLWQPLTVTPTSAAAPSATPASMVTAAPVPASPVAPPSADHPTADPAAANGNASEPAPEAVPSTSGSSSKRPMVGRPTHPSAGAARPPAVTPARPAQPAPAPPVGGPVVPLPGGGSGGLCTAARQAGQLPPNLLQLCHSMYGG